MARHVAERHTRVELLRVLLEAALLGERALAYRAEERSESVVYLIDVARQVALLRATRHTTHGTKVETETIPSTIDGGKRSKVTTFDAHSTKVETM